LTAFNSIPVHPLKLEEADEQEMIASFKLLKLNLELIPTQTGLNSKDGQTGIGTLNTYA